MKPSLPVVHSMIAAVSLLEIFALADKESCDGDGGNVAKVQEEGGGPPPSVVARTEGGAPNSSAEGAKHECTADGCPDNCPYGSKGGKPRDEGQDNPDNTRDSAVKAATDSVNEITLQLGNEAMQTIGGCYEDMMSLYTDRWESLLGNREKAMDALGGWKRSAERLERVKCAAGKLPSIVKEMTKDDEEEPPEKEVANTSNPMLN